MSLFWNGAAVIERVRAAEIDGINKVMGACVTTAKELVHTDTTALQGSIKMEPAQMTSRGAVGLWGSFDISYAIWQELLPGEVEAGITRIRSGGKPYLRPAMDIHYRTLASKMKESLK